MTLNQLNKEKEELR